jgi:hypothetical protein
MRAQRGKVGMLRGRGCVSGNPEITAPGLEASVLPTIQRLCNFSVAQTSFPGVASKFVVQAQRDVVRVEISGRYQTRCGLGQPGGQTGKRRRIDGFGGQRALSCPAAPSKDGFPPEGWRWLLMPIIAQPCNAISIWSRPASTQPAEPFASSDLTSDRS